LVPAWHVLIGSHFLASAMSASRNTSHFLLFELQKNYEKLQKKLQISSSIHL
jgi:hypothetical protein